MDDVSLFWWKLLMTVSFFMEVVDDWALENLLCWHVVNIKILLNSFTKFIPFFFT